MAMQPNFLTLHNRGVVLEGLRVAYNDHGWRLVRPAGFEEYGGYLYRFGGADGGLRVVITAEVRAEAVSLVVDVQGPARIPVQIEMAWRPEGVLETADRRRYALASARRAVVTDQDFAVAGGADRVTVTGLPPMTQRYFDDSLPWMPHVPVVRVLSPFFSPATARLEMTSPVIFPKDPPPHDHDLDHHAHVPPRGPAPALRRERPRPGGGRPRRALRRQRRRGAAAPRRLDG